MSFYFEVTAHREETKKNVKKHKIKRYSNEYFLHIRENR
jgi:hypothetical protein